jgi:hypothetical protein
MKKLVNIGLKIVLLLLLFAISTDILYSQPMNSRGREFWLGFAENGERTDLPTLSIFISSTVNTSGKIEIPLKNYTRTFTVTANSTVEVQIPSNIAMVLTSGSPQGQGIRVTANDPVTVYALNYIIYTSDASLILPIQTIGKEYIVQAYNEPPLSIFSVSNSYVLIVASANNTTIEITPSIATANNNKAGVPFKITLNAGQVYYVKSQDDKDLSGTRVKSTSGQPIAVFGGSTCTTVGNQCCCNHLMEQIFPIKNEGNKEYITVPYITRKGDKFRIVTFGDTTNITFDNKQTKRVKPYSYYDTTMLQPCYIMADNPISIAQFSKSWDTDKVNDADPFMIMLSSFEMTLDVITFNAFRTSAIENGGNYYLNVITPTSGTSSVVLDGNNIASKFKPVTSKPEFSYAQLTIQSGDHTIRGNEGLIAYIYAYAHREAYGYAAGVNIQDEVLQVECPEKKFNTGDTISYPIQMKKNYSILTDGAHKYSAQLSFNGNLLIPILDSSMTYDGISTLRILEKAQDIQLPATLKEVRFKVMLGDSECTTLRIDTVAWDGYRLTGETDCQICVNLCDAGGKRLILSTKELYLMPSNPNPCSSSAVINFQTIESGKTELALYDIFGRKVEVVFSGDLKAGQYSQTIDVSTKPSGVYFYILKTPSQTLVQKLNVLR